LKDSAAFRNHRLTSTRSSFRTTARNNEETPCRKNFTKCTNTPNTLTTTEPGAGNLDHAILAVLVAIASLLGHRSHTEEGLLHTKAADQWAFYQAKNNRLHADEMFSLAFPL